MRVSCYNESTFEHILNCCMCFYTIINDGYITVRTSALYIIDSISKYIEIN